MADIDELRIEAERCERLARGAGDVQAAAALRVLAAEYVAAQR